MSTSVYTTDKNTEERYSFFPSILSIPHTRTQTLNPHHQLEPNPRNIPDNKTISITSYQLHIPEFHPKITVADASRFHPA